MNREELSSIIEATLHYFAAEEASEARIEEQLIADGIQPELARQLVVFVPSAFGRALLQRFSPEFPDTFLLMVAEDGTYKRLFLADEPIFTAALTMASALIDAGTWTEYHQSVAEWSAETQAANSLRQRGNSMAGLRFTEAIIMSDIGPRGPSVYPVPVYPPRQARQVVQAPPEESTQRRPWWKFW